MEELLTDLRTTELLPKGRSRFANSAEDRTKQQCERERKKSEKKEEKLRRVITRRSVDHYRCGSAAPVHLGGREALDGVVRNVSPLLSCTVVRRASRFAMRVRRDRPSARSARNRRRGGRRRARRRRDGEERG